LAAVDPEGQSRLAAFLQGLQEAGWAVGRNVTIDVRWAAADNESMKRFANELVALQPDLIFLTSTPATAAMLQATRTIPVVFVLVADPVGSGFVEGLPRPGGNATGFTPYRELAGRQVGGALEGDRAAHHPGQVVVQPEGGDVVSRELSDLIQSRCCFPRHGGDCCTR
jgi:hypothetical protein